MPAECKPANVEQVIYFKPSFATCSVWLSPAEFLILIMYNHDDKKFLTRFYKNRWNGNKAVLGVAEYGFKFHNSRLCILGMY